MKEILHYRIRDFKTRKLHSLFFVVSNFRVEKQREYTAIVREKLLELFPNGRQSKFERFLVDFEIDEKNECIELINHDYLYTKE